MKNSNNNPNTNNNGANTNNNNNTKLILLHPYILKQGTSNRVWLLAFISLFTFIIIFLLTTLVYTRQYYYSLETFTTTITPVDTNDNNLPLPKHVMTTLLHYASNSNTTEKMSLSDMKPISDVLRKCPPPCNFLVFGLSHETLLWKSLNNHGRTVFIDENRYYAAYMEETHPEIEAYDVQYTTKLSEYKDLITQTKQQADTDCRPIQNLLFSECKLGLNDLPNQFYDIDWDIILVDGPRGYWDEAPGRMAPIFTAGVLARSKKGSAGGGARFSTHIFVHDYNMEAQRLVSEEFLCKENLMEMTNGGMAHFVVDRVDDDSSTQFCRQNGTSDVV